MNDQQCTPTIQNLKDLWNALRGKPRDDSRNWIMAVLHEGKNVLVEAWRKITFQCP